MKTSRIIQFVVAAVLVSVGCVALLAHAPAGVGTFFFCAPSVVLMRRSEMTRPVPLRELWIVIAILAVLAAFIILADLFIPKSAGEHFVHHPAFVIPFWVLMMFAIFWRWRKERRLADA